MRRKIRPIDPNDLNDADDINRTTLKGEMRKLWPAIHKKLTEGRWTARDMVKWLDDRGLSLSVELFRVYLRDIDREHGYTRSKRATTISSAPQGTSNPVKPLANVASTSKKVVAPLVAGGGKRKSILNTNKGVFGELEPPAVDGVVELKQK